MLVSYHVHSKWSDGKGDLKEIAEKALKLGIDELGFSDHYILIRDEIKRPWNMNISKLSDYVADVKNTVLEFNGKIKIRLGLEVDFFKETVEEAKEIINQYPFDYIIGSVHEIDNFIIDSRSSYWEKLCQEERNELIRLYWIRIGEMAESGLCDFVGHMDLTKKFNFRPTVDLSNEINNALDIIARRGLAFEINTSGLYKPCKELYPEREIIEGCFKRKIPVLINSDSHVPEDLIRGYESAYNILKNIGYKEAIYYEKRKPFTYFI